MIGQNGEKEHKDESGINVACAHPCHGKHEYLFSDGHFEIFFCGFAELYGDEFGSNIEKNHDNTGEEFAVIEEEYMSVKEIGDRKKYIPHILIGGNILRCE